MKYTNTQIGCRVLCYSGGLNLSKFVSCVFAFTLKFYTSATPHQKVPYLGVSLGRLAVKTPTVGAHHGADHRDHWESLKDHIIKINLPEVACSPTN